MLAKKHNVADNNDTTKVLGLVWHIPSDTLSLTSKIITGNYPITKREILQSSSSIFDPLGFITPVTIQTKILLQELWKMKVDWDEPLEESLQQRWNKMIQEVKEAAGHVMPRRYFYIYALFTTRVAYICRCQYEGIWGSCLLQTRSANFTGYVQDKGNSTQDYILT